jgi:hypothetical protein
MQLIRLHRNFEIRNDKRSGVARLGFSGDLAWCFGLHASGRSEHRGDSPPVKAIMLALGNPARSGSLSLPNGGLDRTDTERVGGSAERHFNSQDNAPGDGDIHQRLQDHSRPGGALPDRGVMVKGGIAT